MLLTSLHLCLSLSLALAQAPEPVELQRDQDSAAPAPADRGILFASDRDGHRGLYLIDYPGGGAPKALTRNAARNDCPVGSPDASQIAYLSDAQAPGGPMRLWLMKADGSDPRALTTGPTGPLGEWSSSWSSDGKWIIFVRQDPNAAAARASGVSRWRAAASRASSPPTGGASAA